jgi:membrane protein
MNRVASSFREAAANWLDHRSMRMSAALAFYSILSISSLSVCVIAIAGLVYGKQAAAGELTNQLHDWFGESGGEMVKLVLENARQPQAGVVATIVSAFLLLLAASGVFSEIQDDLNLMWGVKPRPGRAIWMIVQDRLLSLAMVLVTGLLLVVSLIAAACLEAFSHYLGTEGQAVLMKVAHILVSFIIVSLLFASIFKYLPDARIAWRDVWLGALATTALFTLGKYGIGWYLAHAGFATSFGAAGSLVAFVVWIYYSSMTFFFGAELTQVTVRRSGRSVIPSANAVIDWKTSVAAQK